MSESEAGHGSRRRFLRSLAVAGALVVLAGCRPSTASTSGLGVPLPIGNSSVPGRLLYVHNGEIWQFVDGATKQVTSGDSFVDPAVAPNGSSLAAVLVGTNHSDLWILSASGVPVRQLTHNLSNVAIKDSNWARKPAWSPDGKLLAYVSDVGKHDMSLWMVDVTGGSPSPIVQTAEFSGGVDWPTWSPDGQRIAFVSFEGTISQIQVYDRKTQSHQAITKVPDGAFDPVWSPDGTFVAFVSRNGKDDDVVVMNVSGEEQTMATHGGMNRAPVWSPDGTMLAFVRLTGETFDIFVSDVTTTGRVVVGEPRQLTQNAAVAGESGLSWGRA